MRHSEQQPRWPRNPNAARGGRTYNPSLCGQTICHQVCEENSEVTSQTQHLHCEKGLGILRSSSVYHGATS